MTSTRIAAKPEPKLAGLPFEILLNLVDCIPNYACINSLSRTSRHFYSCLNRYLYKRDIKCGKNAALWWGVTFKQKELVQRALDFGGDVNTSEPSSLYSAGTLLFKAILPLPWGHRRRNRRKNRGKLEIVRLLLDRGASTQPTAQNGHDALVQAATQGDDDVVRLLVEHNADPRVRVDDDSSVLHHAARACNGNTIHFLIDQGLDANDETDIFAETPLHRAALFGNKDAARALIQRGAIANASVLNGRTPLHFICSSKARYLKEQRIKTMVSLLLDAGAEIDKRDYEQRTPLMDAIWIERSYLVSLLIEKGADINSSDTDGRSVLFQVVSHASPFGREILLLLIENGVDIRRMMPGGGTALHVAAENGDEMAMRILLANGLDINARTYRGRTVLHDVVLQEYLADLVLLLLQNGIDINACDNSGNTALFYAVENEKDGFASLLLGWGADPNTKNTEGETPLHSAIWNKLELSTIDLLLVYGADINATDDRGLSPYHVAADQWVYYRRIMLAQMVRARGQMILPRI